MCLYPIWGKNPKFKPSKKNKGKPPICKDRRLLYIPFKCGKCFECRKQKQREWRVRLEEELKDNFGYFLTLTIAPENMKKLEEDTGLIWTENPNEIAKRALRLFLERVRKDIGKSLKHWCVTELGEDYDRIHLHGIFFGQKAAELVRKHWKYGFIFIGNYCNTRSVNYMTKYMLKVDLKHPEFTGIVLASPRIGAGYLKRERNEWQSRNYKKICVPTYTFRNGVQMAMPKYYKDKLFNEYQRERMWINNLNRGYEWIGGEKVDANDWNTIDTLRKYYQGVGKKIYFDNPEAWDAAKARRAEEKQRAEIAKAKKAGKSGTEFLEPLRGEIPMQENREWEEKIKTMIENNLTQFIKEAKERKNGVGETQGDESHGERSNTINSSN